MAEKLKMGEKMKYSLLEAFSGTLNQDEVISILSLEVTGMKLHFLKGIGCFECFEGICCDEKPALPYYFLPVVHYTGDRKNYKDPIFVKYLRLSRTQYDDICKKHDLYGDIKAVDILVTTKQKGDYKEMDFEVIPQSIKTGPLWAQHKEWHPEIKALLDRYNRDLERTVARKFTEEEFLKCCAENNIKLGTSTEKTSEESAVAQYKQPEKPAPAVQVPDIDSLMGETQSADLNPKEAELPSPDQGFADNNDISVDDAGLDSLLQ